MREMDLNGNSSHTGASAPYDESEDSGFGMSDDEMMRRMRGLVRLAIEKHQLLGLPVARFDPKTREAYLEYPDGRREYVT